MIYYTTEVISLVNIIRGNEEMLKPIPIKRNIYKCTKYTLLFYLAPPEAYEHNNAYFVSANAQLYLSLPYVSGLNKDSYKYRSYRITPTNFEDVTRTIVRAMEWFAKPLCDEIFITTDDGQLLFNADYSGLYEMTDKGYYEDQVLKITPCVIQQAQGKYVMGANIFVNRLENRISLTTTEIVRLYDILSKFNFSGEISTTLELFKHSINTGAFMDEQAYLQRRKQLGFRE